MELNIRNSFFHDWDNIGGKKLNREIANTSDKIKKAHSVSDIHRMKKLISYTHKYKIELRIQTKIYWILCEGFRNKIDFYRIKSEDWCKKNLKR